MKKLVWVLALMMGLSAFAQNGYDFGSEDKVETLGKYKYAQSLIKAKKFNEARPNIYWLLTKTPKLHKTLYQNATKMYEGLVKAEKDPAQKAIFQDSVLALYDKRIQLYGEEAKVLNYKALKAYPYQYKDKTKYDALYAELKKTIELNKEGTYDATFVNYFTLVKVQKQKGNLTDDQVLAVYDELTGYLDKQIATKPEKKEKLEKRKSKIETILSKTVVVDCDFIQNKMGPKYLANPELKLAKRIYKLSIVNKCISNDLFEKVSYFILEKEPTSKGYKQLGNIQYLKQKNYKKAGESYAKALELSTDNAEKGEILYNLASMASKQGKKSTARKHAREAIALGQKTSECYTLIGNLYSSSFNECKVNGNPVTSRAVYLAAYEQYKKAGNSKKMAEAKKQFPSMEDIFNQNKNVGDKINTGCWVNETVTIQKR
ncbi:MAG: tetratricopeptide repeat protein [Cytophagales bacterium]|nr:tetratricopeptide repeat protein [Cytophagales bacterium]